MSCLNPSYTGKRSLGVEQSDSLDIQTRVLTLLILENGLWVQRIKLTNSGENGLNPSYTGKRSLGVLNERIKELNSGLNPSYTGKRSLGEKGVCERVC